MNTEHPASDAKPETRHDEIARRAYLLWEDYGRPEGCDLDIWLTAEATLPGSNAPEEDLAELEPLTFELSEAFSPATEAELAGHMPLPFQTTSGLEGRMPARHERERSGGWARRS